MRITGDMSVASVTSLAGLGVTGLYMIFEIEAGVHANSLAIETNGEHTTTEIVRLEKKITDVQIQAKEDSDSVLAVVKELKEDSQDNDREINRKLDRVIEHLIEN